MFAYNYYYFEHVRARELPVEVYQLMDFYKMGKTKRAGIEYVPLNRPQA